MSKITAEDIEAIVTQFEQSDCARLHLKIDGLEILLSNDPADQVGEGGAPARQVMVAPAAPAPAKPAAAHAPAKAKAPVAVDESLTIVRAPYLGTFYRSPKPGSPAFVELGSKVQAGQDLCLVEVMKLFTAVRADVAGTVKQIYAKDGDLVEAGHPLFAIEPA
jgi:acetyl-CoA carboxylase biotin carboxyl carrier protein